MLFGIVIPTFFLHFVGELFFCLVTVNFFFCHLSSLKTDNSTQPLPMENSGEFDLLQLLVAQTTTEVDFRQRKAGDRLASFPGGKLENEATS